VVQRWGAVQFPIPLYHDPIQFLGACYYVALAIIVKTFGVDLVDQTKMGPRAKFANTVVASPAAR
jgi:hypothetical protein